LTNKFLNFYRVLKPKEDFFKPSKDDIFLVSYPRSGNTWMRTMLAELMYGTSGEDFHDLQYYSPEFHKKQFTKDLIVSEFHIVKSHEPLLVTKQENFYKKVIYMVRDPRDVVLSYFRYSKAHGYEGNFNDFLVDWLTGRIFPSS